MSHTEEFSEAEYFPAGHKMHDRLGLKAEPGGHLLHLPHPKTISPALLLQGEHMVLFLVVHGENSNPVKFSELHLVHGAHFVSESAEHGSSM